MLSTEDQKLACFQGMIKEIKSSRIASGDLEARFIAIFRPLDKGNEDAVSIISEMQKLEEEVMVVIKRRDE